MSNTNRIEGFLDLDNPQKIEILRREYAELTQKALSSAKNDLATSENEALRNRDTVFYGCLLKAIEAREKELGVVLTPSDKNVIIKKVAAIVGSWL